MASGKIKNQLMSVIDLDTELKLLRQNITHQLKINNLNLKLGMGDISFRKTNWLMTMPYNYYYLSQNIKIDQIRKIALINALYGYFFFIEDDVLDEYGRPQEEYKSILHHFCTVHPLRNLAVGQLLELCGIEIYDYIYNYELKYYHALVCEKKISPDNNRLTDLSIIGIKAIPICIPFAAICLMSNCRLQINKFEDMIINYHISHQLYDDLTDLKNDLEKPDPSWLISYISVLSNNRDRNFAEYSQLISDIYFGKIRTMITSHLKKAKKIAIDLRFRHFIKDIDRLDQMVQNCDLY